MKTESFKIVTQEGDARTGELLTESGVINTPAFMPVATLGDVKTLPSWDLSRLGVQLLISNTYHLYLRPGEEIIRELGGLHKFMNWKGPIATDSGGFQVYSLAEKRKIQEDGILFSSHIDGEPLKFTPEKVIDIQVNFRSDLMMPLDECVEYPVSIGYAEEAVERTNKWARRAYEYFTEKCYPGLLFGIVQGSTYPELRVRAAEELTELDFDGYSIGGLVVGESKEQTFEIIEKTAPCLPVQKPRYTMGLGKIPDIINAAGRGIDLFDCVIPTRNARTGGLYTWKGKINIKNSCYKNDPAPISEECNCPACQNYSRAYIRHLFNSNEILAKYLATLHNISFYAELMAEIRKNINNRTFGKWKDETLKEYKGGFND